MRTSAGRARLRSPPPSNRNPVPLAGGHGADRENSRAGDFLPATRCVCNTSPTASIASAPGPSSNSCLKPSAIRLAISSGASRHMPPSAPISCASLAAINFHRRSLQWRLTNELARRGRRSNNRQGSRGPAFRPVGGCGRQRAPGCLPLRLPHPAPGRRRRSRRWNFHLLRMRAAAAVSAPSGT